MGDQSHCQLLPILETVLSRPRENSGGRILYQERRNKRNTNYISADTISQRSTGISGIVDLPTDNQLTTPGDHIEQNACQGTVHTHTAPYVIWSSLYT